MLQGSVTLKSKNPHAVAQLMQRLMAVELTVGVHGRERDDKGGPLAVIAGVHEFGSQMVPARPFIRPTMWTHRPRYINTLRGAIRKAIKGTKSLQLSMAAIGFGAVSDIQRTIRAQGEPQGSFAPLSPVTAALRRRGSTNPNGLHRDAKGRFTKEMMILIDTGRLINSIRWVLWDGGNPIEGGQKKGAAGGGGGT